MTASRLTLVDAGSIPTSVPDDPGVLCVATFDPRLPDPGDQERVLYCTQQVAKVIAENVTLWNRNPLRVVWTNQLIRLEDDADRVARIAKAHDCKIVVFVCDTWAFPGRTVMALLAHLPEDTTVIFVDGNSGPKPGVVFVGASNGAISQAGKMSLCIHGEWPDVGTKPPMTVETKELIVNTMFAAATKAAWKGRRVVFHGGASMEMETGDCPKQEIRAQTGLEVKQFDMKLMADWVGREAWNADELLALRAWFGKHLGDRLGATDADGNLVGDGNEKRFRQELGMYLLARDHLAGLNGIGGGFKSQLEWGSDGTAVPLPVADAMESLFNSNEDHNGPKTPIPFATESDFEALLTMMMEQGLTGGNPVNFMDFRKVYLPHQIKALADSIAGFSYTGTENWCGGLIDGDNSGSCSFNWAGKPGWSFAECMARVTMPDADPFYFRGKGKSVEFWTPGGPEFQDVIAARFAFHAPSQRFTLFWDEMDVLQLPRELEIAVASKSTRTWPHTALRGKIGKLLQAIYYAPANHFHAVWGLLPFRVQVFLWLMGFRNMHASAWPEIRLPRYAPVPLLRLIDGSLPEAA